MKIAILGDLHIGVSHDDSWIQKKQLQAFESIIPKLKEEGITTIIQTGDWFDSRPGISQITIRFINEKLMPLLKDFEIYTIVGNHDMHYREEIQPNSPEEILSRFENVTIYSKPTTVKFGSKSFDMIPWICNSNKDEVLSYIAQSESDYCIGHFELQGYPYYTGIEAQTGYNDNILSRYEKVYSGHFHCQSEKNNVQYVGTPYTLTLGDANDYRGAWIIDTEDPNFLKFILNPYMNHVKLYFDADTFEFDDIETYRDKSVNMIVQNRYSEKRAINFSIVCERLGMVVHSLKLTDINDINIDDGDSIEDENLQNGSDTKEFFISYIKESDAPEDVIDNTINMFTAVYSEAMADGE